MKVLFDTNIVLDVLLDREPFSTMGAELFACVHRGILTGALGATTITTLHYLARKTVGNQKACEEIGKLLLLFELAPVNRIVIEEALRLASSDFEDAVLCASGIQVGVDGIVTRDKRGFSQADVAVYSPEELLQIIQSASSGL